MTEFLAQLIAHYRIWRGIMEERTVEIALTLQHRRGMHDFPGGAIGCAECAGVVAETLARLRYEQGGH